MMGQMGSFVERLSARRARKALRGIIPDAASSVDLAIVGRTLLHAALVGAAAGLVGAAFFAGLEYVQRLLLEDLGGYHPLRAAGENFLGESTRPHVFRPWLLVAAARPGRARQRHHLAAGARDPGRRRRRHDRRLSPPRRRSSGRA